MQTLRSLAIALVASFPMAIAADAGTLITHPIVVESTERLSCLVVNEGKKSVRDVVIEVVRYEVPPPAIVAATENIEELLPLQYIAAGSPAAGTGVYLCRFKFPGSGKWLRASGVLREEGGAFVESQPAR
jgi:hypothetical protein